MKSLTQTMVAEATNSTVHRPRLITPPSDPLRAIFTPEVIERWLGEQRLTDSVNARLDVLNASGPRPSDPLMALRVLDLRAWKAAWEAYLYCAFACGMFEGHRGNDLRARLTSPNDDDCRGAFAECLACWWLAGFMRFNIDPLSSGRIRKNLDFSIVTKTGQFGVEVKAPFRRRPRNDFWCGDDSDKIVQCLQQANKQFDKHIPNVLVLVPALRTSMHSHRRDLVKAAYGESIITFLVDTRTGQGGEPRLEFSPHGKFLNPKLASGQLLKKDGLPAHRRISAILCIEEAVRSKYPSPVHLAMLGGVLKEQQGEIWRMYVESREQYFGPENEAWIEHHALVLNNPYAYHPISESTWNDIPQFVARDGGMIWTDGFEGFV